MTEWFCSLDSSEKIDLVSAIATIASAVVAWISVRALRKQTSLAYEANLILESGYRQLVFVEGKKDKDNPKRVTYDSLEPIELRLINVGLGTATDVELFFEFSINSLIAFVNSVINSLKISEKFELKIENNDILFYEKGSLKISSFLKFDKKKKHNYNLIVPHNSSDSDAIVKIPKEIEFFLLCLTYIRKNLNDDLIYLFFQEHFLPFEFKISVKYRCITDESYSAKFKVTGRYMVAPNGHFVQLNCTKIKVTESILDSFLDKI